MEGQDFRSIGRAAQEALRRRALLLIGQQGLSQAQAAEVVGVQRQTVNIWLQRYRAQGEAGVLDGRRVSPRRGKGLLTAAEAGKIQGWIRDRTPDQLKLPFALWTSRAGARPDRAAARQDARPVDDPALPATPVDFVDIPPGDRASGPMGMTPQKPLARARERSPTAIAAWLDAALPGDRQASQVRGSGDLLGRRDRDQQSGPDWLGLCAEGKVPRWCGRTAKEDHPPR